MATDYKHGLGLIDTNNNSVPLIFDFGGLTLRPHWEDTGWIESTQDLHENPNLLLDEPINVAIYNHIFYPEVYKELVEACNLLPKASHFVTTDSVDKASIIQALHSRWSCHRDIEIRVMPNRGRDLAPLFCAWGMEPAQHPVVLHLHSKVSSYNTDFGTSWRQHMLKQLLNSEQHCAAAIIKERMGLVIPWPHPLVAPCCHWGPNYGRSKLLLRHMGVELKRYYPLSFPAGSFFWCAGATLKPMLELGLKIDNFAAEPIGQDGFLPHILERCLGFLPWITNQSIAVMVSTENDTNRIVKLPNPLCKDTYYYEMYEELLELYLQNHSDLFGGQPFHMSGPI